MKKIMVGFDGSNAAREALNVAIKHANAFKSELHVVTSMVKGTDAQQSAIRSAEKALDYIRERCESEGLVCNTHLLIRGHSPGEDLVLFAEEIGVDEMVIGVRRRSRVGKILMGSNAQYIIIKAPCPVVAVK